MDVNTEEKLVNDKRKDSTLGNVESQPSSSASIQQTTANEEIKDVTQIDVTKNSDERTTNDTKEINGMEILPQIINNPEDSIDNFKEIKSELASNTTETSNKETTSNDNIEVKQEISTPHDQESTQAELSNIMEEIAQNPLDVKQEVNVDNVEKIKNEIIPIAIQEKIEEPRNNDIKEIIEVESNILDEDKQKSIQNDIEEALKPSSIASNPLEQEPSTSKPTTLEFIALKPFEEESISSRLIEEEPTSLRPFELEPIVSTTSQLPPLQKETNNNGDQSTSQQDSKNQNSILLKEPIEENITYIQKEITPNPILQEVTLKSDVQEPSASNPSEQEPIALEFPKEEPIVSQVHEQDPFVSQLFEQDFIVSKLDQDESIESKSIDKESIASKIPKQESFDKKAIVEEPNFEKLIVNKPIIKEAIGLESNVQDLEISEPIGIF